MISMKKSLKYSFIIPTFNRYFSLTKTLTALSLIEYRSDLYEIIVVDDGSVDNTKNIKLDFPAITYIHIKHRGAPYCRNIGADRAKGSILIFIDDDCHPKQNFLITQDYC
jgi:glucosyl-dolichyl phosphate glucuronosyltransferase